MAKSQGTPTTDAPRSQAPPPGELPWVIEALLFVAEEPQPLAALARAAGAGETATRRAIEQLKADYEVRGLRVVEDMGHYRLATAPAYAAYVEALLGSVPGQRLSRAALETLTIIAYRQPCTRAEIEAIRGVNSDRLVATLEARGLVDNTGRGEGPGRPLLYRTTMTFLEHFGIGGAEELPPLPAEAPPAPDAAVFGA
ncbi:MAG: SMC-Scp complex subunit ScpB [Tepidiformaceae bacterium]